MKDPLFVFEDIVIPDADDILEPIDDPDKPEEKQETKGGIWDSGEKENIWRGVDPKDIWTADSNGNDKEPWSSDGDDDTTEDNGAFGDIF